MQPLDRDLNIAVLHIARELCPAGYEVSEDAPDTYAKLRVHLDRNKKMLVWSGASENTIFGRPEINWAFRAWHDWCHYSGAHPFTPAGERAVFQMQCSHLLRFYGDSFRTRHWMKIIESEIIGQQNYFLVHGRFPHDQRAFVEACLNGFYLDQSAE